MSFGLTGTGSSRNRGIERLWLANYASLLSDSGVRNGIQYIRQKVHRDVSQADREDTALHEVIIAAGDRLNRQPTDTRPRKDCLSDDGSREQRAELQAQHSNHGDH